MIPTLDARSAIQMARDGLAQLVDGTWQMPGDTPKQRSWAETSSTVDTSALKALPPASRAQDAIDVFARSGVVTDRPALVYDRAGFFSAPWVAWLLASHGHGVSLVTGVGEEGEARDPAGDPITSQVDPAAMNATKDDVLAALGTDTQIVDARPPARFRGDGPEPRPDCRAGHIPGSLNLPFGAIRGENGYADFEDIARKVAETGIDLGRPIITSCGSGVTASAIAVALQRLGADNVRVYQGSWAEWGPDADLPIETGP